MGHYKLQQKATEVPFCRIYGNTTELFAVPQRLTHTMGQYKLQKKAIEVPFYRMYGNEVEPFAVP